MGKAAAGRARPRAGGPVGSMGRTAELRGWGWHPCPDKQEVANRAPLGHHPGRNSHARLSLCVGSLQPGAQGQRLVVWSGQWGGQLGEAAGGGAPMPETNKVDNLAPQAYHPGPDLSSWIFLFGGGCHRTCKSKGRWAGRFNGADSRVARVGVAPMPGYTQRGQPRTVGSSPWAQLRARLSLCLGSLQPGAQVQGLVGRSG